MIHMKYSQDENYNGANMETVSPPVSQALAECRLDKVTCLLGHPYRIAGKVVEGKKLGRTVGMPTANIDYPKNIVLPPDGCYVTLTYFVGERNELPTPMVGITNVGRRPSVDNFDYTTVENHILDFSGDLYGKVLLVEFLRFMRPVQKFDSLAAVKAQTDKDVESLRGYIDSLEARDL